MAFNLDDYNEAVKGWGTSIRAVLQSTGRAMGIAHVPRSPSSGESLAKIREKFSAKGGEINKVSFGNINRSLIYTTVGAGKGRGGLKGSRWTDKYGNKKTTNPVSLGKMGTGDRTAKPFINNTLDSPQGLEALGDIVSNHLADAIVNSVYIK